jgi:hypothetical protein
VLKENGRPDGTGDEAALLLPESGATRIDVGCAGCVGVGLISGYKPIASLTETPQINVTNPLLCCNQQRKARRRVLPANTNLPKNYFQTTGMYLYNRCQTFEQRQFNFYIPRLDGASGTDGDGDAAAELKAFLARYPFASARLLALAKPGSPLSLGNYYVAQCNPAGTVIPLGAQLAFMDSLRRQLVDKGWLPVPDAAAAAQPQQQSIQTFLAELRAALTAAQLEELARYVTGLALSSPAQGGSVEDILGAGATATGRGCARVYYKPNNPQFAVEGAVSSATRTLKLEVATIERAALRQTPQSSGQAAAAAGVGGAAVDGLPPEGSGGNLATAVQWGVDSDQALYYKEKTPRCGPATFLSGPYVAARERQNKRVCMRHGDGAQYHNYNTVNTGSAGNYIGATQSAGTGYADKRSIGNATLFDNMRFMRR